MLGAKCLISNLNKLGKTKQVVECLTKLFSYFNYHNNYINFVQNAKINLEKEDFFIEINYEIFDIIIKLCQQLSKIHRRQISYILSFIIMQLNKKYLRAEVIAYKDISSENIELIKKYIAVSTNKTTINIKFILVDSINISNFLTIIFRNYTIKLSFLDLVLQDIQSNKKENFWKLIQ